MSCSSILSNAHYLNYMQDIHGPSRYDLDRLFRLSGLGATECNSMSSVPTTKMCIHVDEAFSLHCPHF